MGKFVLKALTGPVKGKVFPLEEDLEIGRSEGDILLNDPAVSYIHAVIDIDPDGKMTILDQDSKNKIFINGRQVVEAVLEKDTQFTIGRTTFQVLYISSPQEILLEFMKRSSKSLEDSPVELMAFSPFLEVLFVNGLQKGQKYCLYYGPRFFGSHSTDLPLFEKSAPKQAFVLKPTMEGGTFISDETSPPCSF